MFRKLNPSQWEWQYVLTIGTFFFTLAVFLFFIIRAIRMKRSHAEHMGRLAVDDDTGGSTPYSVACPPSQINSVRSSRTSIPTDCESKEPS